MFKQVLKNKSTFIGIALFLCVLFGASLWYQSFMRKEGMTDLDNIQPDDVPITDLSADKMVEDPVNKKNKIYDSVIPFAENSSVGPSMAGEPINYDTFTGNSKTCESMKGNTRTRSGTGSGTGSEQIKVQTYTF